jgi:hypothetical protein
MDQAILHPRYYIRGLSFGKCMKNSIIYIKIAGSIHYNSHIWWHGPMTELLGLWQKLQDRISLIVTTLQDAALLPKDDRDLEHPAHPAHSLFGGLSKKQLTKRRGRAFSSSITNDCYEAAVELFTDVLEKRTGWHAREKDVMYRSLPVAMRPISPVPFPRLTRSPEAVEALEAAVLQARELSNAGSHKADKKKMMVTPNNKKGQQKGKATETDESDEMIVTSGVGEEASFLDPALQAQTALLSKLIEGLQAWKEAFGNRNSPDHQQDSSHPEATVRNTSSHDNTEEVDDHVDTRPSKKRGKFIVVGK